MERKRESVPDKIQLLRCPKRGGGRGSPPRCAARRRTTQPLRARGKRREKSGKRRITRLLCRVSARGATTFNPSDRHVSTEHSRKGGEMDALPHVIIMRDSHAGPPKRCNSMLDGISSSVSERQRSLRREQMQRSSASHIQRRRYPLQGRTWRWRSAGPRSSVKSGNESEAK